MKSKLLHESAGQRTYAVILETGDEVLDCLQQFTKEQRVSAAQLTAIGALSDAKLNYFDWEQKKYLPIPVQEQVEVDLQPKSVRQSSLARDCAWDAEVPPPVQPRRSHIPALAAALAGRIATE